jgi:hypothetical protein
MIRIASTPRRRLAVVGSSLALLAAAGTGVAVAGPAGPTSKPAGTPTAGSTQFLGSYSRVISPSISVAAGGFRSIVVSCPAGQRVFGGGESNSAFGTVVLTDSWPQSTTSWLIWAKNNGAAASTVTAYAICGS